MDISLRVPKLEDWYYAELGRLYDTVPARHDGQGDDFLVMGCPIWGEEFVVEFLKWCAPTIFEPVSTAALAGRCRLVICCGAADRLPLMRALQRFEPMIELQLITIPDELIALTRENPQIKLFLLGTVHKLVLQIAKRLGAGFSMLMPDHAHCIGYYAQHRELSHRYPAIAQCGISAAREPAQAEMEQFRNGDGTLMVPPRALGDIAWRHLHPHHLANVMAADSVPDRMPRTQLMLWRLPDRLVAHSCRPNPVWLAPHLVARHPPDFQRPATLDCEVPILAPQGCYLTTAGDGMVAIELTPSEAKPADGERVPFGEFAQRALNEARYSAAYLELLSGRTELPLSENLLRDGEPTPFATDEQVERDLGKVLDLLRAEIPPGLTTRIMQRIASAPEALGLSSP